MELISALHLTSGLVVGTAIGWLLHSLRYESLYVEELTVETHYEEMQEMFAEAQRDGVTNLQVEFLGTEGLPDLTICFISTRNRLNNLLENHDYS